MLIAEVEIDPDPDPDPDPESENIQKKLENHQPIKEDSEDQVRETKLIYIQTNVFLHRNQDGRKMKQNQGTQWIHRLLRRLHLQKAKKKKTIQSNYKKMKKCGQNRN